MSQILNDNEIKEFNKNGAIHLKGKFDIKWIEKLKVGINKAKINPSPRFTNHTKDEKLPSYLEDFWTWNLHEEFTDFVYNSPTAKIASELLEAKRINLVMDNWFFREAGSKSKPPFHHDISYFDFEGSMCVLWIPLEPVKKQDGIAWVKGSHLWNKLFLRTRFNDGHKVDGEEGIVNGIKYELTPDIIGSKENYEFLEWDLEVGDCVYFDIRTLHGALHETTPKSDVNRFTLRMAKENSKIIYRGDWAKEERAIMEANGYKNGDDLNGKMFPVLYELNSN
ncbi:phytanoyl-CoA dioxygenase family protein [Candidatus Pelagibacter bacterium]|jgi:ectoine hydroxylase-related dioxygenase (phytanoyl-CoA dioxygenase family)|nr:phytanoyl-CoA dioxygenase family protein [Candidatus Pelagibacter sp.]MDB2591616.1 phytanoyl-CoA dioxygenase family protein [Candidatus Pelagibacter bacterium]MDB2655169.1 phytanoyl-CoA dioxygenase family protein [Candidatus Pelagibacter bacterium]MDB2698271.1 phytanoyl-CoA dioxygenase family protein [Candidatus Pelagibacter bacterium]MDC0352468.1 phytanoyl-CoA dioxygenase family protein [Candidatus Pelagibacter sp.]